MISGYACTEVHWYTIAICTDGIVINMYLCFLLFPGSVMRFRFLSFPFFIVLSILFLWVRLALMGASSGPWDRPTTNAPLACPSPVPYFPAVKGYSCSSFHYSGGGWLSCWPRIPSNHPLVGLFFPQTFFVPKHMGGSCHILSLKWFKPCMHIPTFRMPNIRQVWLLAQPGNYTFSYC